MQQRRSWTPFATADPIEVRAILGTCTELLLRAGAGWGAGEVCRYRAYYLGVDFYKSGRLGSEKTCEAGPAAIGP